MTKPLSQNPVGILKDQAFAVHYFVGNEQHLTALNRTFFHNPRIIIPCQLT